MKKLLSLALLACSALILTACGGKASAAPYGPTVEESVEGYQQYSESSLQNALDEGDNVMLFFGATRCPPCVKLHKDILENADSIPENLTVLTADIDKADELKEKYGVTQKHTALYFNADGSIEKKNVSRELTLQDIFDVIKELDAE